MPTNVPQTNDQKAYELGKRLSEKSTYTGLTVLISMALPLLIKLDPHLAGTSTDSVVSAVSYLGMGIGGVLTILFKENGSKAVIAFLIGATALLGGTRVISSADATPVHHRIAKVPLPLSDPRPGLKAFAALQRPVLCDPLNLVPGCKPTANAPASPVAAATPSALTVAQNLLATAPADIAYAIQLANQVNTPASKVRAQCYTAIGAAIPVQPTGSTMPPTPHVVTNIEMAAELADTLTPTSPVFVNCAGAATLQAQNVLAFVNAVVTGITGIAVLAPKIP